MRKEVELQSKDVKEQQKKNSEQELKLRERAYETIRIEKVESENIKLNDHVDELTKQLVAVKKDKESVMKRMADVLKKAEE